MGVRKRRNKGIEKLLQKDIRNNGIAAIQLLHATSLMLRLVNNLLFSHNSVLAAQFTLEVFIAYPAPALSADKYTSHLCG